MNAKSWIVLGCLMAAVGVGCGAMGAHGVQTMLHDQLEAGLQQLEPDSEEAEALSARTDRRLAAFETASRYHLIHALGIVVVGILLLRGPCAGTAAAGWAFLVGIVLFSGMLYGWSLSEVRALAMVVPLGGTSFIVGWLILAYSASRMTTDQTTASRSDARQQYEPASA